MDSIRQQKVSQLIKEAMSEVFTRNGRDFYGIAFVTITNVWTSPDLSLARVYLSIFNVEDKDAVVHQVSRHVSEIRGKLGNKLRHQLKRIPQLEFYNDEMADEMQRVNDLLKDL